MSIALYKTSFTIDFQSSSGGDLSDMLEGTARRIIVSVKDNTVDVPLTGGVPRQAQGHDMGILFVKSNRDTSDAKTYTSASGFAITASIPSSGSNQLVFDIPATSSSISPGNYHYDMVLVRSGSRIQQPVSFGKFRIVKRAGDPLIPGVFGTTPQDQY